MSKPKPIIEAEVVRLEGDPPPSADDSQPPRDDAEADIAEFEQLLTELAELRGEGTEVEHLAPETYRELRRRT
jgi:hypothetical protein